MPILHTQISPSNFNKPTIIVSPEGSGDSLPGATRLSLLAENMSYHEQRDIRHPLGVYNISILRICQNIIKCAERLEKYWSQPQPSLSMFDDITDYLELSMYSAAEHVDDLETIVKTFYKSDREAVQSANIKRFKGSLNTLRSEISHFTNTIKHAHGRIRIYDVDFFHGEQKSNFLGFFVEGFSKGAIAPNPILHSNGKRIISMTSYLWKVLTFLGLASQALANFLNHYDACTVPITAPDQPQFREAVLKLARLPAYSLD